MFFDGPVHEPGNPFQGIATAAAKNADFIADTFTNGETGRVSYLGVSEVNVGLFVVDTDEKPVLHVGPVGHTYATVRSVAQGRLTNAQARKLPHRIKRSPWSRSYTSHEAEIPVAFVATCDFGDYEREGKGCEIAIRSRGSKTAAVQEMDFHHKLLGEPVAFPVHGRWKTFKVALSEESGAVRVMVGAHNVLGEWQRDLEGPMGFKTACGATDGMTLPKRCDKEYRVEQYDKLLEARLKREEREYQRRQARARRGGSGP